MARLISRGTGNWTAAATWGVVDTTSFMESVANNTALTTAYVASSAFTPGAITVEGIAVKMQGRAASPSGTMTVSIGQAGAAVSGTEVVINVADLQDDGLAGDPGWLFFKFASPVTLSAATAYTVMAKTSVGSQVWLYRDGTANNWSRMLRTSTTQTPVAGDIMHIMGEHTGAGTFNTLTVTMNETAATDYGAGTDGVEALTISNNGVLTYGVATSTAYVLRLSGDLVVYAGGILNIGTVGTPIPSTSSAVLEFDSVLDGGMGLIVRNGATVVMQGNPVTAHETTLTADRAAAATTLAVASTSGWVAGDEIVIASTTRTPGESEKRAITTVDSATQVTIPALTNAHGGGGTTHVVAEVIHLTRNVKVRAAVSTVVTYMYLSTGAVNGMTVDIDYVEFRYLGENVANKRGIEFGLTTGTNVSISFNGCSIHDTEDWGIYLLGVGSGNPSFTNMVMWNCNTAALTGSSSFWCANGASFAVDGLTMISCSGSSSTYGFQIQATVYAINNLKMIGCANGAIGLAGTGYSYTVTNIVTHSNALAGLYSASTAMTLHVTGLKSWRNGGAGLGLSSNTYLTIIDGVIFGNTTNNIISPTNAGLPLLVLKNTIISSDATFTTANGINMQFSFGGVMWIVDCSFGTLSAHTGADINVSSTSIFATLFNTVLASTVEVTGVTIPGSFVRSHKHDASGSTFKTWMAAGLIESEATVRHTASGYAWRLDPSTQANKLCLPGATEYDGFEVAVAASTAVTVKGWVRKDASYNGTVQPRLVVLGGMIAGVPNDVAAALTVAADIWEELSVVVTPSEAGVLSFRFDCQGTLGFIYVDDITVTQA